MKRYFGIAAMISLFATTGASAQGKFFQQIENEVRQHGRQFIEQEFGGPLRQGQDQKEVFGSSLPSESGRDSGGQGRVYNPGDGSFLLPGNGGGQTIVQPGYTTDPYGRVIYPGDRYQPNGNYIQPGTRGTIVGSTASPGSPVPSQQFILIRCPQGNTDSINYTLSSNGRNFVYTIYAGQEQRFPVGSGWTITYMEGSTKKRYKLEGGKVYSMRQKDSSNWQLFAVL